jgi:DNA-binding transcriptional MerR regulator
MTGTHALWTLDELAERVDAALSTGYDGPASGRVRAVPDQRAIRYYSTLGLVDRPAARRGSTALYGHRHLLQLVAIKKLQAGGLPLARIQLQLAGATDQRLERVAQLSGAEPPVAPAAAVAAAPPSRAAAFWKRTAAAEVPAAAADLAGAPADPPTAGGRPGPVVTMQGVRLADGVTLLLDRARPLRDDEVGAIQAAAEHLLEALRARGLGGRPRGREPR